MHGTPQHQLFFVAFAVTAFVAASFFAAFMTSRITGWHALAERFSLQGDFPREEWHYRSAVMRNGTHYNNCLTVGASPVGLYLSILWPFRIQHPNLFIPWNQISISRTKVLFWDMVRFQLGRENPIPFTIRPNLAEKIRQAAGTWWPKEQLG
jgi:hypothetical protein